MVRFLFKTATGIGAGRRAFGAALAALCLAVCAPFASAQNKANLSMKTSFNGVSFIPNLQATLGTQPGQVILQWTAPSYNTSASTLTYQIEVSTGVNISSNTQFVAGWPAQQLLVFSTSTPPIPATPGTTQTMVVNGLPLCTPYNFAIRGVDNGTPQAVGFWMRSVPLGFNVNNSVTTGCSKPPQTPYGVAMSSASYGVGLTSVTLSWMPVVRYADVTPFAVSTAPAASELQGYSVFRSTTWIPGVSNSAWIWNDVADLSTATLTWTDLSSSPQCYYYIRAFNNTSASVGSVMRTPGTDAALIVAPDNLSFYQVNAANVQPIEGVHGQAGTPTNPNSAFLINVSSRPQDLGTLNGRVIKSLEFDAYMGGYQLSPTFSIAQPGLLSLHYDVTASSGVTPSAISAKSVASTPSNLSVYWFNGTNWVQLYGTIDQISQTVTIQTEFFGQYQLRTVERTGGFSFNMAGVSNRYVTPNGDGKNDNVVFTFDNPLDSAVTAKIFDLRGRVVASSLPPGPMNCSASTGSSTCGSLIWDGTSGGRSVPGGVYIYQIQAEGQSYSGTLVIIK
jgi:hypothetical protein